MLRRLRAHGGWPVVWSLAASLSIQGLGVVSGIILARVLDPAGRGELAAIMLWPAVAAVIAGVGIQQSSTYFAAARGRDPKLVSTVGALALVQGLIGLLVGLAVVRFTPVLNQYGPTTVDAASLFAVYVPLNLTTLSFSGILNGLGHYRAFQTLRVLVIALSAIGIVMLALVGTLTPKDAAVTYLVAELVTSTTAILLTLRRSDRLQQPSVALAKEVLAYGARAYVGGLSALVNLRFDQAVLSIVVNPAQYGYYVVATTLTSLTNLVGVSLGLVALPVVAREGNPQTQARLARRYVLLTVALAVVVTVPLLVIVPTLIKVAFGSAFSPAVDAARILLVAAVSFATARALEACLQGLGRPLDSSIGEGVAVLVTVVGVVALVPALGIEGAAIASFLAYSGAALFMHRRLLIFNPSPEPERSDSDGPTYGASA